MDSSFSLALIIRGAFESGTELGLTAEQVKELASLYYKYAVSQVVAQETLAIREGQLSNALASGGVDARNCKVLIEEIEKLRAELQTSTKSGFEALQVLLSAEQFSKILARGGPSSSTSAQSDSVSAQSGNVKEAVAEYLDNVIKDKDVVEIEVATKAADRLYGWAKLFAFFLAVPVAIILGGLSIFGITTMSDFSGFVKRSEKQIRSSLETATDNVKNMNQQIADLRKQTDVNVADLRSQVKRLQECVYGSFARPGESTKSALQAALVGYEKHLTSLGYIPDPVPIAIDIEEQPGYNMFSYYDADKRRIVLNPCAAGETGFVFHEFAHHALMRSLPFNPWKKDDVTLLAIEGGLADYFACSYQDDPTLGRVRTQAAASQAAGAQAVGSQANSRPKAMVNLENKQPLSRAADLEEELVEDVSVAWGGLFWDIRKLLGRDLADRILFAAWRKLPESKGDTQYPTYMARNILAELRARSMEPSAQDLAKLFEQRSLTLAAK